jgi:hypothetical protein
MKLLAGVLVGISEAIRTGFDYKLIERVAPKA